MRAPRRHVLHAARSRGVTLIELLVVIVLVAIMTTAVVIGLGAATNAKLKGAATLVQTAIRSAYTRSSATAKPTRVVFQFLPSKVWIEEGSAPMLTQDRDLTQTGGADPATEAEKYAQEQAQKLLQGPVPAKPQFKAVKQNGFEEDDNKVGRELDGKIRFREIMISHQADPVREGRAYLYVWPGGQTELAYLWLSKNGSTIDRDTMTLTVHPVSGKVSIKPGAVKIVMDGTQPLGDREDPGGF